MPKLDSQNRLNIPNQLMEIAETDFSSEIRIYATGKEMYLDNPSKKTSPKKCFGQVNVDQKGRFIVPKLLREIFNLKPGDNFALYVLNGRITFKKIVFIPENR